MTDHAPLMLSVSGARGIVGESMTPDVAARFACVFGSRLASRSGGVPTACLGRDSRASGEGLAQAAANGLMAAGCDVIDLGVVATPTIGVMVTATASGGGIMITASHNPNPWNGIKCIGPGGSAPPAAEAEEVIVGFRDHDGDLPPIDPDRTLSMESRGDDTHIARVLGQIDPAPICAKNYGVVLDSVNGAGCRSGLKLLELLGCDVLHLNGDPTGDFAHTPEPRESNLGSLMEVAAESDVVIGFAQDPDADPAGDRRRQWTLHRGGIHACPGDRVHAAAAGGRRGRHEPVHEPDGGRHRGPVRRAGRPDCGGGSQRGRGDAPRRCIDRRGGQRRCDHSRRLPHP